jgi:hypothetical protein
MKPENTLLYPLLKSRKRPRTQRKPSGFYKNRKK